MGVVGPGLNTTVADMVGICHPNFIRSPTSASFRTRQCDIGGDRIQIVCRIHLREHIFASKWKLSDRISVGLSGWWYVRHYLAMSASESCKRDLGFHGLALCEVAVV